MVKKIFAGLVCFVGVIVFISTLHGQGSKKTITLPSGEVVWDLNGEWRAFVEIIASISMGGGKSYAQIWKITQTGSSFVAIRMINDPYNQKGSQSLQGELDKSGIKKVTIFASQGPIEAEGQISHDGNKIVIDDGRMFRLTLTRK